MFSGANKRLFKRGNKQPFKKVEQKADKKFHAEDYIKNIIPINIINLAKKNTINNTQSQFDSQNCGSSSSDYSRRYDISKSRYAYSLIFIYFI